ncbi:MAG: hypothetical protein OEQ18_14370, partial [Gammaproteobacteria bacterium]|nr:hypothetical protein [Gammaproteobacteria bacterium]
EVDRFRAALNAIAGPIAGGSATGRLQAAASLQQIGYELTLLEDRYFYFEERPPIRGRGVFVIDAQAQNALVVQAPAALDERGTAETATLLFQNLGARGLALAGARRAAQSDGSTDVLTHRNSLFQTFHKTLSRNHALQVRSLSALQDKRPADPLGSSELWVTGGLPADLDLPQLRRLVGALELKWALPPFSNVQREASSTAFAELLLRRADMRRVAARAAVAEHEVALELSQARIDGYLKEWLFGSKQRIAQRGSDLYRPPRMEELLYLDEEVISPLLEVAATEFVDGEWTAAGVNELRNINVAVNTLNYEIIRFRHRRTDRSYIILAEQDSAEPKRYWGTYVFRMGTPANFVVQVPQPGFELTSFDFGAALFERLEGSALLIAGAHLDANRDGSADISSLANTHSVFTLVSQVLNREYGATPLLNVQTRAFAPRDAAAEARAEVLYSVSSGARQLHQLDALSRSLIDTLHSDGIDLQLVDGSPHTAGYETGANPQSLYLDASHNKVLGTLWVSPETRQSFRKQTDDRMQEAQLATLEIPTVAQALHRYLLLGARFGDAERLPGALKQAVSRYIASRDIVTLARLQSEWPGFRLKRWIDVESRQAFLMVVDRADHLYLIANLAPLEADSRIRSGTPPEAEVIDRFLATRSQTLEFTPGS